MTMLGRECTVCFRTLPVLPLREEENILDGEDIQTENAQDLRNDLHGFPPDEVLQTCSKTHHLDICYSCLDIYVSTKLDTHGPAACDATKCPKATCPHIYTFDEINGITSTATFSRYDELVTRKVLGDIPNFRWCLSPDGCGSGAIYCADDVWEEMSCRGMVFDTDPRLTEPGRWIKCPDCHFSMCFEHQVPSPARPRSWLEQFKDPVCSLSAQGCAKCRQGILDLGSEESTERWIEKNTKRCPREWCRVLIEKKSGCSHMTCARCQLDFCWDCLTGYDLKHETCPCRTAYFTDNAERYDRIATELRDPDDIRSQATLSYDFGYSSVIERLRNLQELGIIPDSQPMGLWDPMPDMPHPQANVRGENLQQGQNQGDVAAAQGWFALDQGLYIRRIQAEMMALDEERAAEAERIMADTVVPDPNTNTTLTGRDRPVAPPSTPQPAPNITRTRYNVSDLLYYGGPNTLQPQSEPSSAPPNPGMEEMPMVHSGTARVPPVGYDPFYGPLGHGGYAGGWRNEPYDHRWSPLPAAPTGPHHTTHLPPVAYGVPQSLDPQYQGRQGNNHRGRGRDDTQEGDGPSRGTS